MKILVWGTGEISERTFKQCDIFNRYNIVGFIDNDKKKQNTLYYGRMVYSPDVLNVFVPDKIVIMTDSYEEIKNQVLCMIPECEDLIEDKNYFYVSSLFLRYEKSKDLEIKATLNYIKNHGLDTFNAKFVEKYNNIEINAYFDSECGMYYIKNSGHKIYLSKSISTKELAKQYYKLILIEQDPQSPHKYTDTAFKVDWGDTVVDVGVAEGNFSLEIVERASKIYMVESDNDWIDALKRTFYDYKDKIVFINKYASSLDEGKYARLDSVIDEPIDFMKMDIEGFEWDALMGSDKLFKISKKMKCVICAYHRAYDEILIRDALLKYGMECSTTPGYMWFTSTIEQTGITSTRLSRGIVRGRYNQHRTNQK